MRKKSLKGTVNALEKLKATMQNRSSDSATMRARLNQPPALIEAAKQRGDKKAEQILCTERGHLENIMPILEAQTQGGDSQKLTTRIAQCQKELEEAELTLRLATQFDMEANRAFELQGRSITPAVEVAKKSAEAQTYEARHRVAVLRLELAQLRVRLEQSFYLKIPD